jgi:hypothetical protein
MGESIHGIGKKIHEVRVGERKQPVRANAQFSSGKSDNHLLSFGEFAAMYLLDWNEENWSKRFSSSSQNSVLFKLNVHHQKQIEASELGQKKIATIRRLLANILTYMIFDSHEITDDWNIDGKRDESVKNSMCGRQIVTNGLVAFWFFQSWGMTLILMMRDL